MTRTKNGSELVHKLWAHAKNGSDLFDKLLPHAKKLFHKLLVHTKNGSDMTCSISFWLIPLTVQMWFINSGLLPIMVQTSPVLVNFSSYQKMCRHHMFHKLLVYTKNGSGLFHKLLTHTKNSSDLFHKLWGSCQKQGRHVP